jgi:hypothetical protein
MDHSALVEYLIELLDEKQKNMSWQEIQALVGGHPDQSTLYRWWRRLNRPSIDRAMLVIEKLGGNPLDFLKKDPIYAPIVRALEEDKELKEWLHRAAMDPEMLRKLKHDLAFYFGEGAVRK